MKTHDESESEFSKAYDQAVRLLHSGAITPDQFDDRFNSLMDNHKLDYFVRENVKEGVSRILERDVKL